MNTASEAVDLRIILGLHIPKAWCPLYLENGLHTICRENLKNHRTIQRNLLTASHNQLTLLIDAVSLLGIWSAFVKIMVISELLSNSQNRAIWTFSYKFSSDSNAG